MSWDVTHFSLDSSVLMAATQDKPSNNYIAGSTHAINKEQKHPTDNKGTLVTKQSLLLS